MKVIKEIVGLAREHHLSLVLANKCINTSKSDNAGDIKNLCEQISKTFTANWQQHFDIEEQTIFLPLIESNSGLAKMVSLLKKEHTTLNNLAKNLLTDNNLLAEFGELLRSHTRTEDRQLFPHLKNHLTSEQLKDVLNNCLKHG